MDQVHVVTEGIWTDVNVDPAQFHGSLKTNRLCWGEVADHLKSAYVFKGCSNNVPLDGSEWVVGTFEHHNHPIPMPPYPRFTAHLQVTMTIGTREQRTLPLLAFSHHETPNRGNAQRDADIVGLDLVQDPEDTLVEIGGRWYTLHVKGFLQHGTITPSFRTYEDAEPNAADVWLSFKLYDGPA